MVTGFEPVVRVLKILMYFLGKGGYVGWFLSLLCKPVPFHNTIQYRSIFSNGNSKFYLHIILSLMVQVEDFFPTLPSSTVVVLLYKQEGQSLIINKTAAYCNWIDGIIQN